MIIDVNFRNMVSSSRILYQYGTVIILFVSFVFFQVVTIGLFNVVSSEEYWWIAPQDWAKNFATLWSLSDNFGFVHSQAPYFFPQGLFFIICSNLYIPIFLSQKIWFAALNTASFIGMVKLTSLHTNNYVKPFKGKVTFPIVLAALTYTFSPYFLSISILLTSPKIVHATLPFLIYYSITYQQTKDCNGLPIFVCLVFSTSAWVNPPQAVILLIPIGIRILFELFSLNKSTLKRTRNVLILSIISFVALAPVIWALASYLSSDGLNDISSHGINRTLFSRASIYDVFRLTGSWAFYESHNGFKYFNYSSDYKNIFFYNFLPIVILVATAIIIIKNQDKLGAIIIIFGFMFMFSCGGFAPFSTIYEMILTLNPIIIIFREPYAKFGLLLAIFYSFQILIISNEIKNKLKNSRRTNHVMQVILSSCLVCYQLPVINGDVIREFPNSTKNEKVKIPNSYTALSTVKSNPIVLLPKSPYVTGHFWEKGYTGNPIYLNHNSIVLQYDSGWIHNDKTLLVNKVIELAYKDLSEAINILNGFGVEKVIFRKDILTSYKKENILLHQSLKSLKTCKSIQNNNEFEIFNCKGTSITTDYVPDQSPSYGNFNALQKKILLKIGYIITPVFNSINLKNNYSSVKINEFRRYNISHNKHHVIICQSKEIESFETAEKFLARKTSDCDTESKISIFHIPSLIYVTLILTQFLLFLLVVIGLPLLKTLNKDKEKLC